MEGGQNSESRQRFFATTEVLDSQHRLLAPSPSQGRFRLPPPPSIPYHYRQPIRQLQTNGVDFDSTTLSRPPIGIQNAGTKFQQPQQQWSCHLAEQDSMSNSIFNDDVENLSGNVEPDLLASDDVWVFPMIDAIREFPAIWNSHAPGHSDKQIVGTCWQKVASRVLASSDVLKTVEVLKTRWKTIMDSRSRRKKPPTGSAGKARSVKTWKYERAVEFLNETPTQRNNTTNLPATGSCGTSASEIAHCSSSQANTTNATTDCASSSSKRKRTISEGDPIEEDVLATLKKVSGENESRYSHYGQTVISILNSIKSRGSRKEALNALMDWIRVYQGHAEDDNE